MISVAKMVTNIFNIWQHCQTASHLASKQGLIGIHSSVELPCLKTRLHSTYEASGHEHTDGRTPNNIYVRVSNMTYHISKNATFLPFGEKNTEINFKC